MQLSTLSYPHADRLFQANLALRYLVGLPVAKDRLHYFYYDGEGELVLQKFSLPVKE